MNDRVTQAKLDAILLALGAIIGLLAAVLWRL